MKTVVGHILDIVKVSSVSGAAILMVDNFSLEGLLKSAVLVTVIVYNSIKIYKALKKKKDNQNAN